MSQKKKKPTKEQVRVGAAERKRAQRQRDASHGWVTVSVRVAQERSQEVRDFAASLAPPAPPSDPDQLDLLEGNPSKVHPKQTGDGAS